MLKPESQAVLPNSSVRFKSTLKGTPPFIVKWFKEETELITGPSCFTGLEGLSCFLDLYAVQVSQSGIYVCQVSNDAGTERCTVELTVKGWALFSLRRLYINITNSFPYVSFWLTANLALFLAALYISSESSHMHFFSYIDSYYQTHCSFIFSQYLSF